MRSPPTPLPHTWIIVPTYNESQNLVPLVHALRREAPDVRLLIVDDNSPDGTGRLADDIAHRDRRVAVLHRIEKQGLGAAYRAGFREVLQDRNCGYVVQMDCDFSHAPEELHRLLAALDSGNDLVIGSRYVPGGSTPGWGFRRRAMSKMGSFVARSVLRLPYRDLTGGFKAWRADLLAQLDLVNGYAHGYGFQIETTWTAHRLGARIAEVPITFRDRTAGTSKMTGGIALEALLMVLRLRFAAHRLAARQPATSRIPG